MTTPAKAFARLDPAHWRDVHIQGDRNRPVFLPDRRRVNRKTMGTPKFWTRGSNGEEAWIDG